VEFNSECLAVLGQERAKVMNQINKFLKDESGATAIEYALIASIVGLGIIVGLTNMKDALVVFFNNMSNNF
jgi:pilus assembly protein Flp/PilA